MKGSLIQLGAYMSRKQKRSNSSDWMSKLRNSDVFIVVSTEPYFKSAALLAQCEYAKALKKPFRVLHHKEAEIPDGLFDDIEDIKILEVDKLDRNSLIKFRDLILEDFPEGVDNIELFSD
jgi:hypothetical protein